MIAGTEPETTPRPYDLHSHSWGDIASKRLKDVQNCSLHDFATRTGLNEEFLLATYNMAVAPTSSSPKQIVFKLGVAQRDATRLQVSFEDTYATKHRLRGIRFMECR
jgi:hypothetical protein